MFTPVESFIGGIILGVSIAANLLLFGRVTGYSGLASEMVRPTSATVNSASEQTWRALFIAGVIVAGAVASSLDPNFPSPLSISAGTYGLAGLAVGFGTRLGKSLAGLLLVLVYIVVVPLFISLFLFQ